MENLINKIILDNSVTGQELINDLKRKKEYFPTLESDITAACEILNADCFLRIKRSRNFWNIIVNERVNLKKPKITINGTDNLYEIAMKARAALKPICSEDETNLAIDQLFQAEPISVCLKGIEERLDITYNY